MIKYRKADWSDIEQILDLIDFGFSLQSGSVIDKKRGQEHRILFSYLYSKRDWDPNYLFIAEKDGIIITIIGFFPQILSFEGIKISVWAISPVVTHPEYRGLGIAGECLLKGLEFIKSTGIAAVFLWGLPNYYPKLGFVPVLPRYKTKINLDMYIKNHQKYLGGFRRLKKDDLTDIFNIYNKFNSPDYWLNPVRTLTWWQDRVEEMDIEHANLKEVPFPKKENFIVWENYLGEISGYLYFREEFERKRIIIDEASAVDIETAISMLTAFFNQFIRRESVTLYIRGTPVHPLNTAAYRMGGINLLPAPLAGMIKVIDWPNFLRQLLPLFNNRFSLDTQTTTLSKNFCWHFKNGKNDIILNVSSKGFELDVMNLETSETSNVNVEFTKLIFGIYDRLDIKNMFSGIINDESLKLLQICFPLKYPFIWDANYLY